MFTRDDTKAIKGVAVILMLFHHLAAFPKRVPVGFEGFSAILWQGFIDNGYLQKFASGGKICVSLFFFLAGYGLYKRWESGKFSLAHSIALLYKQFWKVFAIFIPIAFLFFARSSNNINSLTTRYVIESKRNFLTALISNALGFTTSFNAEWWFFASYLCALPLGYLFLTTIRDHQDFLKDIFWVVIINIFICNVFPNLAKADMFLNIDKNVFYKRFFLISEYASPLFEGIVFAKYDTLVALKKKIKELPLEPIVCVFGIAVTFWCRMYVDTSVPADILYTPFLIAFLSNFFDNLHIIKIGFSYFGKHSTNMWYMHSFYCYYFLEITKIVYCTKIVWVDLFILVVMSLATSIFIEFFYKHLRKLWDLYAKKRQTKNSTGTVTE